MTALPPAERVPCCPACGSDRVDRLAGDGITPFRRFRCQCGRRLRDRGTLIPYVAILALAATIAAGLLLNLDRPDSSTEFIKALGLGAAGLVVVVYVLAELARPAVRVGPRVDPGGEWYVARGGEKVGPLTLDGLRGLAAAGGLARADMVLDARTGQWMSAGSVTAVFPVPAGRAGSAPTSSDA